MTGEHHPHGSVRLLHAAQISDAHFGISARLAGDRLTVMARGELDLATAPRLREVSEMYDGRFNEVAFILADLSFVDMAGLRPVIDLHSSIGEHALIHRHAGCVRRLVTLTGLEHLLHADPVCGDCRSTLELVASNRLIVPDSKRKPPHPDMGSDGLSGIDRGKRGHG